MVQQKLSEEEKEELKRKRTDNKRNQREAQSKQRKTHNKMKDKFRKWRERHPYTDLVVVEEDQHKHDLSTERVKKHRVNKSENQFQKESCYYSTSKSKGTTQQNIDQCRSILESYAFKIYCYIPKSWYKEEYHK